MRKSRRDDDEKTGNSQRGSLDHLSSGFKCSLPRYLTGSARASPCIRNATTVSEINGSFSRDLVGLNSLYYLQECRGRACPCPPCKVAICRNVGAGRVPARLPKSRAPRGRGRAGTSPAPTFLQIVERRNSRSASSFLQADDRHGSQLQRIIHLMKLLRCVLIAIAACGTRAAICSG